MDTSPKHPVVLEGRVCPGAAGCVQLLRLVVRLGVASSLCSLLF